MYYVLVEPGVPAFVDTQAEFIELRDKARNEGVIQ